MIVQVCYEETGIKLTHLQFWPALKPPKKRLSLEPRRHWLGSCRWECYVQVHACQCQCLTNESSSMITCFLSTWKCLICNFNEGKCECSHLISILLFSWGLNSNHIEEPEAAGFIFPSAAASSTLFTLSAAPVSKHLWSATEENGKRSRTRLYEMVSTVKLWILLAYVSVDFGRIL